MGAGGAALALGAIALGMSGCRTNGAGPRSAPAPGITIVLDQPTDGRPGRAQVDDHRWLMIPAAGTVDVAGVAPGLELASLLFESTSAPGAVRAVACAVIDPADPLFAPWIVGHRVEVTTIAGAAVTGTVAEVGTELEESAGEVVTSEALEQKVARTLPNLSIAAGPPPPDDPDADGVELVGSLEGTVEVVSLIVVDDDGLRHAIRGDAIATLRIADLPSTPTLRCRVTSSAPGRHAVRIAYQVAGAGWTVRYRVTAVDEAAPEVTVVPHFAVAPIGLSTEQPITVVLQASAGGADAAPVEVWRGALPSAMRVSELVGASSSRPARVRYRYRGADGDAAVWRELVFERRPTDVPGELAVRLGAASADVPWHRRPLEPAAPGARLIRVPLAVEPTLVGFRQLIEREDDDGRALYEVRLSVANRGANPVRVLVEEPLTDDEPVIRFAAPAKGVLAADRWQLELDVAGGALARAAVAIQYGAAR